MWSGGVECGMCRSHFPDSEIESKSGGGGGSSLLVIICIRHGNQDGHRSSWKPPRWFTLRQMEHGANNAVWTVADGKLLGQGYLQF